SRRAQVGAREGIGDQANRGREGGRYPPRQTAVACAPCLRSSAQWAGGSPRQIAGQVSQTRQGLVGTIAFVTVNQQGSAVRLERTKTRFLAGNPSLRSQPRPASVSPWALGGRS